MTDNNGIVSSTEDDIKSISSYTNFTLSLGNPFLIENDSRTAQEAKLLHDDMNGTVTLEDTFAGNGIVNGIAYTDN